MLVESLGQRARWAHRASVVGTTEVCKERVGSLNLPPRSSSLPGMVPRGPPAAEAKDKGPRGQYHHQYCTNFDLQFFLV